MGLVAEQRNDDVSVTVEGKEAMSMEVEDNRERRYW